MNLRILMKFTSKVEKNRNYSKWIEFLGISDFECDKEFMYFVEYGRLGGTSIDMNNVITFKIYTDNEE